MSIFDIPLVIPRDLAGMSFWLNIHNQEHLQLVNKVQSAFPSVTIPLFDLGIWPEAMNNQMYQLAAGNTRLSGYNWVGVHQVMTDSISQLYKIQSYDFTEVDIDNEPSWRQFEVLHGQWHQLARAAAGIS